MASGKLSPQVVGNIGLYYVCYRLSRLGWNVMPTARNARGVDILAYSHDASKVVSIQVKALSSRSAVPLGSNLDRLFGDSFVICRHVQTDRPEAFVLSLTEVRTLSHPSGKGDKIGYWIERPQYEASEYAEAWNRVGCARAVPLPTPASKF